MNPTFYFYVHFYLAFPIYSPFVIFYLFIFIYLALTLYYLASTLHLHCSDILFTVHLPCITSHPPYIYIVCTLYLPCIYLVVFIFCLIGYKQNIN